MEKKHAGTTNTLDNFEFVQLLFSDLTPQVFILSDQILIN